MQRLILRTAAFFGATAVILGAFGAHALKFTLSTEQLGWWQTGVQYQLAHALALLSMAGIPLRKPALPVGLMVVGISIFSGTLYLMALGFPRWLGAITPLGGALLILGWLTLALAGTTKR